MITRPTSNQEAFDAAVRHLATMTEQALAPSGLCVYYNDSTKARCAIGGIMPFEMAKGLDPDPIRKVVKNVQDVADWFKDVTPRLLAVLQAVHDAVPNWRPEGLNERGVEELAAAAEDWGLDPSVIAECFTCYTGSWMRFQIEATE